MIGIGAGVNVDAQVLVYHDILGYGVERVAKFVQQYQSLNPFLCLYYVIQSCLDL
ncbi:3-methyl-2-oxobutanoate hydroxymethyltransferase [Paenibacillus sp. ICGEB2008]|uniref:3-methyl-2-oxobutanoate hydroxymethyltransferase n=1 Tax=Paenibacillus sp. ICGEB2008 TaxID=996640 RepID=UPI003FA7CF41